MRPLTFVLGASVLLAGCGAAGAEPHNRRTQVSIVGDQFHVNGAPTYAGRTWATSDGAQHRIEGLLMNARLVQGIFDDPNPETRGQWMYPDTGRWNPERNTQEFIDAMAAWREHGLIGFTINLQGGCPYGYCRSQPWNNSAFESNGSLRTDFMNRLERILDRADELGMVPILGYFYFGQDERLEDDAAVVRAVDNTTRWVLEKGYRHVVVEINNECDIRYDHAILQCERVHELIERVKGHQHEGRRLYVSTSLRGGRVPPANIVAASDYVLLHGNGVRDPARMSEMVRQVRAMDVYRPMPIVNNEDDRPWRDEHQGWREAGNNFVAAVTDYAGWGFFDFRLAEEHGEYNLGFQSVPVNWQISSDRKRAFFDLLARITGSPGTPRVEVEWSDQAGGGTVRIEGVRPDAPIQRVELLVNNRVAATAKEVPFEFLIDMPQEEHWVRARATYRRAGTEVIVESPYYRIPWWPYGGPSMPVQR
jgi:hypothetical protein